MIMMVGSSVAMTIDSDYDEVLVVKKISTISEVMTRRSRTGKGRGERESKSQTESTINHFKTVALESAKAGCLVYNFKSLCFLLTPVNS